MEEVDMALIKCPECGKEVSTLATTCPHCGCPVEDSVGKERLKIIKNIDNHMVQCKNCGTWNFVGVQECKECHKIITGQDYIQTNQKAAGISTEPSKNVTPFYGKTWFVILMLCCWCFPIGLFLMWKYKKFNKPTRIIITTIYALMLISIAASNDSSDTAESNAYTSSTEIIESESDLTTDSEITEEVTVAEETVVEKTSEPVLSEEEFKAACQEIAYKTLLRTPDEYVGTKIVIVAKIKQVMQGGWFDDGQYYRIQTDNDGYEYYMDDEYFMYDCRVNDSLKILNEDVIKIYAEFAGLEEVKRALTGVKEEVPAIKAYYIDLISE